MKTIRKTSILALTFGLFALGTMSCQAQPESKSQTTGTTAANIQADPVRNQGIQQIEVAGAEKLIANQADLQILDVRTPGEVTSGIVAGAKTINVFDADFNAQATAALDKTKPVLVYCKVGGRSSQAATKLETLGFSTIYNLQGGMDAWKGSGKPVQK